MTLGPIDPPNLNLGVDILVDWLELSALFSEFGIARLDALQGSLQQLEEEAEENIGKADGLLEQLIDDIENEVELRQRSLGETYPFFLSNSAEELEIVGDWENERYAFYLVCLITSHVTRSPILNRPPTGALLTKLRNRIFQVLATLAMAGLSGGPALSVGWPRVNSEQLVDLLQRAVDAGAGFNVRNPPAAYVSPDEKDGGIDVISWTSEVLPPPTTFFFGQAASGNNWPGKPVHVHASVFEKAYMLDLAPNQSHATIIPFRVLDERTWQAQNQMHRSLIDRLRLPPYAYAGLSQARAGVATDEADQLPIVVEWLTAYRADALTPAAAE